MLLVAFPAEAEVSDGRFHLFRSPEQARRRLFAPEAESEDKPGEKLAASPAKRHFWLAAAEVTLLNVGTWVFDRYALKADYAYISLDRWKENLKTGFVYDHDIFSTNQALHPYHGSFYYNAARSNGYNFWESALFTSTGSLIFEFFGEDEPASINDFVNTTIGGTTQGEIFHRVTNMILDNTANGSNRLFRELGGLVLDPVGGFNRLVRGEWKKDFPNPDDRLPVSFSVEVDAGFQHNADGTAPVVRFPNQSLVGLLIRYGDPFFGENRRPFDYFESLTEFGPPSEGTITRWQQRGQLFSWELSASRRAEHRLGLFLNYDYTNNQAQIFSAQTLSANVLSRFPLVRGTELRTELSAIGFPLAALQTDYTADDLAKVGRPYDYGPGGGARVLGRVTREGLDVFLLSYQALWISTTNGVSQHSAIQSLRAEGRLPLSLGLALGAGIAWNRRITSYDQRPTVRVEGPQWRVFGTILLQ